MAEKLATAVIAEMFLEDSDDEESTDNIPLLGDDKSRIRGYTEDVVPFYTVDSFRRMFRIDIETYKILLGYMEGCPSFYPAGHGRREPISIYRQLLVTLWYVGGTDSITKIADRFGMSESSVISCRNNIFSELINMTDSFIRWPSIQEMADESQEFERRNGFPNIIEAVDGTHIEIKAPTSHPQSYVNRKGYHSIQLQCVCRCNMAFSHVFTGYPGSFHDARLLKNSDLWGDRLTKCNMVHHILGDGAYKKWVLTPYCDNGHLDLHQKKYNHLHSSNRVIIERAFAILQIS
ncbi:putative nuclease HARBI1 [Pecten maximus]|uniref:putative nuclease HARBI1 n=1 Tax=Pecten maximus TaxID=6579 RepID=UPI00145867C3|nr:putative nuclease HARBI1 [Pecten maximus]